MLLQIASFFACGHDRQIKLILFINKKRATVATQQVTPRFFSMKINILHFITCFFLNILLIAMAVKVYCIYLAGVVGPSCI